MNKNSEYNGKMWKNIPFAESKCAQTTDSKCQLWTNIDFILKVWYNYVNFIIQEGFDNPIPIEVGIGKKNKKQIKNAMNRYDSDYGIVISNSTMSIEKDEDVIFISPRTFSFM